jgi:hypothetical protein
LIRKLNEDGSTNLAPCLRPGRGDVSNAVLHEPPGAEEGIRNRQSAEGFFEKMQGGDESYAALLLGTDGGQGDCAEVSILLETSHDELQESFNIRLSSGS